MWRRARALAAMAGTVLAVGSGTRAATTPYSPLDWGRPIITIEGHRDNEQYRTFQGQDDGRVFDAGLYGRDPAPATWHFTNVGPGGTEENPTEPREPYPLIIDDTPDGAFVGGVFTSSIPYSRNGIYYINSAAVYAKNTNGDFTFWGTRIKDPWDGIRADGPSGSHYTIAHSWITSARDDAIENDYMRSMTVENSLIEDAYVGISIDPGSGGKPNQGHLTLTVRDTLIELSAELNATTEKGSPGWIKATGDSPSVLFERAILKFSVVSSEMVNRTKLVLGETATKFRGATDSYILWTGEGDIPSDFPASLSWLEANGFTVLMGAEAQQFWDNSRAAWIEAHPFVPRAAGDPLPIPEPSSLALLALGGLLFRRRRAPV